MSKKWTMSSGKVSAVKFKFLSKLLNVLSKGGILEGLISKSVSSSKSVS